MRFLSCMAVAVLVVGCASGPASQPGQSGVETVTFSRTADSRGELTPDQMRALAPRVATLRPDVDSVVLSVGETFSALRFMVRVLDSAGTTLGQMRRYSFGLADGAAKMDPPPVVRGVKEGVSLLRISFPSSLWVGRADDPVESFVRVIVRPR